MECKKLRSYIDAVARVMSRVEDAWSRVDVAALLLMDIKGAFDHVSSTRLQKRVQEMSIDTNLVNWVVSFLQIEDFN